MSNCVFEFTGRKDGERFVHRCTKCEREVRGKYQERAPKANCKVATEEEAKIVRPLTLPPSGPGTEMAAMLREMGIKKKSGCGCDDWVAKMNAWGVEGCKARRAEIVEHMKKAYDLSDYWTKAKAAALAWLNGLPMSLDGLTDEAILRATKAQCEAVIREADSWTE